jgi:protein-disulfide isomerase
MHPHAAAAAELARVARAQLGDDGFWKAHDLIYAAQPNLGDAAWKTISEKLGLKWSDVRQAIKTARFGAILRTDSTLSDAVDVPATPTLFVNGKKLVGAQPYEKVKALVDAELTGARTAVQNGASRASLYQAVVEKGRRVPVPADAPPP